MNRKAGFTLLEMLVAMGLCSMLLMSLWTMYSTYADLFDRGQARVERSQLSRALMQQLADDLQSALQDPVDPTAAEPGGDAQRRRFGLVGTSGEVRFDVLQVTPLQGSQLALRPAQSDQEEAGPRVPELRTISYSLATAGEFEPDPGGELAEPAGPPADSGGAPAERGLVRQELDFETPLEPPDGTDPLPPTEVSLAAAADDTRTVVPEVLGIEFRYFDGRGWSAAWNSLQRKSLPAAVEITLTIGDPGAFPPREEVAMDEALDSDGQLEAGGQLDSEPGTAASAPPQAVTTTLRTIVDLPASSLYRRPRDPQVSTSPRPAITPRRIAPQRWSRPSAGPRQQPEDWIRTGNR